MEPVASSQDDCDRLLKAVVPFAEQQLTRYREFYPFGATMSPSGEIAFAQTYDGQEHPDSHDVIERLHKVFRDGAASGKFRATALAFDISTVPPGATAKTDAIAVMLDHRDQYSVIRIHPYSISPGGGLRLGETFTRQGANDIFRK